MTARSRSECFAHIRVRGAGASPRHALRATGDTRMKALQVRRRVARLGPGAGRVGAGAGDRRAGRAARVRRRRPARAPRARLAPGPDAADRHLRLRPVDDRRARVDLLRRLGQLPVRARPRGRRRARRRHAGRPRAGARPRGTRLPPAVRRGRARRRRRLRPPRRPGVLEPGIQTGFCCSTGGGWSPEFVAHETPAAPHRRRRPRRAGGADRTARRRHPRRPDGRPGDVGRDRRRARRRRARRRHDGPRRRRRPRAPRARRARRRRRPLPPPATRRPASSAPTTSSPPPSSLGPCAGSSAATSSATTCRLAPTPTIDAVGSERSIAEALAITRPRGRVVLMGMPAEVTIDLTGLWHRETELVGAYTYGTETLPDGRRRPHVRPRHRGGRRDRRPSAGCRRPTDSPTTSTPSPTPPPPGDGAPSRSPSTSDGRR